MDNLRYMYDRLGFIGVFDDHAYMMDDFGNAVPVPFSLGLWYFQDS